MGPGRSLSLTRSLAHSLTSLLSQSLLLSTLGTSVPTELFEDCFALPAVASAPATPTNLIPPMLTTFWFAELAAQSPCLNLVFRQAAEKFTSKFCPLGAGLLPARSVSLAAKWAGNAQQSPSHGMLAGNRS